MGIIYKEETEFGKIIINENTIFQMILPEIEEYSRNLYVSNSKGKRTNKFFIENKDGVEVKRLAGLQQKPALIKALEELF